MIKLISGFVFAILVCFTAAETVENNNVEDLKDMLIGVSAVAKDFARRDLIRKLQINTYNHTFPNVHWKFQILNPNNDTLREEIMHENRTHGDIVILEKFIDNKTNAISVKPYEFFKYVAQNLPGYRYVAKMDDDTFMNITGLYDLRFTEQVRNQNNTIIAVWHKWDQQRMQFPHGGFYAISWDLVLKLNELYDTVPMFFKDKFEDFQVGIFFRDANITFNKVWIHHAHQCNWKTFDESTPMSKCNITHQYLTKWSTIIRVHLLKEESLYRNISSYFVEHELAVHPKPNSIESDNESDISGSESVKLSGEVNKEYIADGNKKYIETDL